MKQILSVDTCTEKDDVILTTAAGRCIRFAVPEGASRLSFTRTLPLPPSPTHTATLGLRSAARFGAFCAELAS